MPSFYQHEVVLLHGLRSGLADAVDYWFTHYQSRVRKYIAGRVSNDKDVDELVQETFVNCLKHLPLFRGDSGIETWMQGIARHEVADFYRKKYAKKAITSLPLSELLAQPVPHDAHETADKVRRVIAQLSHEYRELLLMKYIDGKQVRDIAREVNRSVKAVESDLFRARREFKELYATIE